MPDINMIRAVIDKIRIARNEDEWQSLLFEIKTAAMQNPVRLAFVNAHAINLCYDNDQFLYDLSGCDYLLRDGSGMRILFKLMKRDAGINLNGTDFIPRILQSFQNTEIATFGTENPYLECAGEKIAAMGLKPVVIMGGV